MEATILLLLGLFRFVDVNSNAFLKFWNLLTKLILIYASFKLCLEYFQHLVLQLRYTGCARLILHVINCFVTQARTHHYLTQSRHQQLPLILEEHVTKNGGIPSKYYPCTNPVDEILDSDVLSLLAWVTATAHVITSTIDSGRLGVVSLSFSAGGIGFESSIADCWGLDWDSTSGESRSSWFRLASAFRASAILFRAASRLFLSSSLVCVVFFLVGV